MKVKQEFQYLLARRTFDFCTFGPSLTLVVIVLWSHPPQTTLLTNKWYLFGFASLLIAVGALAWLAGFIFLWPIGSRVVSKFNGAPYRVGEDVRILTGPNRGCVARVYEIWDNRGQVRVALGTVEKTQLKDIFAYFEVCRD